jgi:hypothetical protein
VKNETIEGRASKRAAKREEKGQGTYRDKEELGYVLSSRTL